MHKVSEDTRIEALNLMSKHVWSLHRIFALYNEKVFSNQFSDYAITFRWSNGLKSSAGNISYRGCKTIRISLSNFFLQEKYFADGKIQKVNGILCANWKMAALMVFEHELVHLFQQHHYHKMGHGTNFKRIAKEFFGHTEYFHCINLNGFQKPIAPIMATAACQMAPAVDTDNDSIKNKIKKGNILSVRVKGKIHTASVIRKGKVRVSVKLIDTINPMTASYPEWRIAYHNVIEIKEN